MAAPKLIGGGRALRVCDGCGGVDDHPRHAIVGGPDAFPAPTDELIATVLDNAEAAGADPYTRARLLRDLVSLASIDLHMDCCRERGCPTGACNTQTAGAEAKRGKALLSHLAGTPSEVAEVVLS